ncbi:hypothetical protein [Cupriavidus necator]
MLAAIEGRAVVPVFNLAVKEVIDDAPEVAQDPGAAFHVGDFGQWPSRHRAATASATWRTVPVREQ